MEHASVVEIETKQEVDHIAKSMHRGGKLHLSLDFTDDVGSVFMYLTFHLPGTGSAWHFPIPFSLCLLSPACKYI